MAYIDGFMAAVPEENRSAYEAWVKIGQQVFKDSGAESVVDAWEDDVPDGQVTSMRQAVAVKPGEKVAFAWVIWPDKAARDAGFEKLMADPRMSPDQNPMPFDGQRLIFGGFTPIQMTS